MAFFRTFKKILTYRVVKAYELSIITWKLKLLDASARQRSRRWDNLITMDILELGYKIVLYFIPFLFALCFHEYAHGFVAKMRGDDTAEAMGRLTMNPLAHADLIGTVILPLAAILTGIPFFGWAKPVPVNPRNLKTPKTDMFWVALAGPLSNILLALIGAFALVIFKIKLAHLGVSGAAASFFQVFIIINLALAIFNMIPVHPLDGGKVLARFLPDSANRWMEANQQMMSFALLFLFLSGFLQIIRYPMEYLFNIMISFASVVVL